MLLLSDVTVRYGGEPVVDRVSLSVADGQWLCLIGPNGAGKSSALRAVASLVEYSGLVAVDSVQTRQLSARERAKLVAYVPQQPEMPGGMTVLEYTLLGRTPHIGYFGVESAADRHHCMTLLDRLGVGHLAGRMLPTLSGGEAQRAVLARALAQQAPLLLLDEPTSALDLGNRVEALELVDELRREFGLSVLSVMHDLTLAGQFADRLALLAQGRIDAVGGPAEVLTPEILARTFGPGVRVVKGDDGLPIVIPLRTASSTSLAAGAVVTAAGIPIAATP